MKELIVKFLDYTRSIKNRSEHTVISYETDLLSFQRYCSSEYSIDSISSVTHLVVRSWVMTLKTSGMSNVSINRKISALKSFYKYLKRKQVVDTNPMAKVLTLKKSKRLPSFVPKKKMDHIMGPSLEERDFSTMRNDLVIALLYMTGIRRSELVNLKYSDIDASRQELKVIGKGNKERRCPITPDLLHSIESYKEAKIEELGHQDHDYLIVTNKGKKAYPKLIFNIVSRRLKAINASEKTSPHVLRHTFATHLSSAGAELNAVKELLGHASLAATQVYTHNSIDRLKKEYHRAHPKGE